MEQICSAINDPYRENGTPVSMELGTEYVSYHGDLVIDYLRFTIDYLIYSLLTLYSPR